MRMRGTGRAVRAATCVGALVAAAVACTIACRRPVAPPTPVRPPLVVPPAVAPPVVDPVVLSPTVRAVPGTSPADRVRYRNPGARTVLVAGSWDQWHARRPLPEAGRGDWWLDAETLNLPLGRYEFKFLPDGAWEPGENRLLEVNEQGRFERPPDLILEASLASARRIHVALTRTVPRETAAGVRTRLLPGPALAGVRWLAGRDLRRQLGYSLSGDTVVFCFDEAEHGLTLGPADTVTVAGTFNGWQASPLDAGWRLARTGERTWEGRVARSAVAGRGGDVLFKFVVNGHRWMPVPSQAPNAAGDGRGNVNRRFLPDLSRQAVLELETRDPVPLSNTVWVVIEGLSDRAAWAPLGPGPLLDAYRSDKALGAVWDPRARATTFRLFAPRASGAAVELYDGPELVDARSGAPSAPREIHRLGLDPSDGVWETTVAGAEPGCYYAFRLAGPSGPGDGFAATAFGDPYARAVAHARGASIVVDPAATSRWFGAWSDQEWRTPAWQDAVIYETHVRHQTVDPSSRVPSPLRGRFAGLLATEGLGTGLDHLRALGVNMIEFMPVAEYENGTNAHQWGYAPAFFFAPEASFAQAPLAGSQVGEFKHLVDELHRRGFGVILDVVYNHVGDPNVFGLIDRRYYFRMTPDLRLSNASGCGNDMRSEAPMMRRLIVDNVLYWMREFHVDGFRFDLAELIDMDTLDAVRDAARAVNPRVVLISEPWSSRGDHKAALKGQGWASWNNEFRDAARRFARGEGGREDLAAGIAGSVASWAATPMQSVNYLESHDDRCLADELTVDRRRNGANPTETDVARHCIAATALLTALGIPMLAEGQEFLRSKQGLNNTYDQGDRINALRWTDRTRPPAAAVLAYYQGLVRLRASALGAALRMAEAPPPGYLAWVKPAGEERALGYVLNARRSRPVPAVMVLLNAADRPVSFTMELPAGRWRLVGDGRRVDAAGVDGPAIERFTEGAARVQVPAMRALVYVGVEG